MAYARNESQLVAQIVKAIAGEYPDAYVVKIHGNPYQRAGIPDLLVVRHGILHGFEIKHQKPGESIEHLLSRVSVRQQIELEKLHAAGAVTCVAWSVEMVLDALKRGTS